MRVLKQIEYVHARGPERDRNNVILKSSFALWRTAQVLKRRDTPRAFSLIMVQHLKWSVAVIKNVHLSLSQEVFS